MPCYYIYNITLNRHRSPLPKKLMGGSKANSGRPRLFKKGFLVLEVLVSCRFLSLHKHLPPSQLQTQAAKQTCACTPPQLQHQCILGERIMMLC